jgi:hypothetical protein
MQELLRVKNNLMRVIAENNHYLSRNQLESVSVYNETLQNQLAELDRLIEKGEKIDKRN